MSEVRNVAERLALRPALTERSARQAQALAILDLADAIREVGDAVHEGLDNIEAGLHFLTEAVQGSD